MSERELVDIFCTFLRKSADFWSAPRRRCRMPESGAGAGCTECGPVGRRIPARGSFVPVGWLRLRLRLARTGRQRNLSHPLTNPRAPTRRGRSAAPRAQDRPQTAGNQRLVCGSTDRGLTVESASNVRKRIGGYSVVFPGRM